MLKLMRLSSALCVSVFRISQRKQLFFNLISLLLLQICYCVLHSSARAGSPALSRSASVTIATAMDKTVESTWLPKGNCSSQAVSACVASHMSDKPNVLTQSFVTSMSLGKLFFQESLVCVLYENSTNLSRIWKIPRSIRLVHIEHAYLTHRGHAQWRPEIQW